ncbi:MAG: flagellar hook-associated protein FlgL [Oscillospiraceae bacterium]
MRVTQGMVIRSYNKNLSRNIKSLADSNERLSTKRKLNRVSDDTAAVAKSFTIREQIYKNEIYLDNATNAQGELSAAEDNIKGINELFKTTIERLTEGNSDTKDHAQRQILAEDIDNMAEQVLKLINGRFTDKYVFGGSSNGQTPFTIGKDGHLQFNGQSVLLDKPFPENIETYIDIGLGMVAKDAFVAMGKPSSTNAGATITATGISEGTVAGDYKIEITKDATDPEKLKITMKDVNGNQVGDVSTINKDEKRFSVGGVTIFSDTKLADGETITVPVSKKPVVDPSSAFNPRTSGIDVLGCGMNEDGFPNNIYEIMKEMSAELKKESPDKQKLSDLLTASKDRQNKLIISLTNVGTKSQFVTYNVDRLKAEESTLQATRSKIEDVNVEQESIFNKVYESNWLITLQLGTKIIPPSIFDYMR